MATPHNQRQPKCNHEVLAKMTTFLSFDVGLHWATLMLGALRPPLCFNKLFFSINEEVALGCHWVALKMKGVLNEKATIGVATPGLQSVCAGGHESACLLQPDASHTIACPSSFGARHAAHERINRVFAKFIRKAGCEAIVNPSTRAMLGEHFDDAAARILFPRIPTEAAKKDAEVLKSAFHLAETTTGSAREAAQECIRRMVENCARKHEGLRVDCIAELSNSLLWIDVGIVHPTARSKLAQTLSFVRQHDIAEKAAMGSRCRHAFVGKPTPPVKSYQTLKEGKYQAMVDQASQQVAKGRRVRAPVLAACIFSHLGELSPVAIKTVEIITMAYKAMVSKMLFEDGIPLKKRTAAFRMQFKDALMCANASGFGRTLSVTGRPRAGCRISSPDANGGFPDWEVLY